MRKAILSVIITPSLLHSSSSKIVMMELKIVLCVICHLACLLLYSHPANCSRATSIRVKYQKEIPITSLKDNFNGRFTETSQGERISMRNAIRNHSRVFRERYRNNKSISYRQVTSTDGIPTKANEKINLATTSLIQNAYGVAKKRYVGIAAYETSKEKLYGGRNRRSSDDENGSENLDGDIELTESAFRLKLSEFNFDNPGKNTEVFVELEAVRIRDTVSSNSDLSGYKMVILRGEPLEIVVVVDLQKMVGEVKTSYLVLGKAGNRNVVVNLASPDVESVFSSTTLLPDLDDSLYAVLIVYSVFPSEINDISLDQHNGKFLAKPLDWLLRTLLREITIDMQVVGRKAKANYCKYFDSIRPTNAYETFRKVLLRDWDGPQEFGRDFSLNNCCQHNEPFDPHCWNIGEPTPGYVNDCSRKQIVLEEFLVDLPSAKLPDVSADEGECSVDYPGVSSASYSELNDQSYERAVGSALEGRWECGSPNRVINEPEEVLDINEDPKTASPSIPLFTFSEEKWAHCKEYLIQLEKIDVPEVREWLYMVVFPEKCVFSCHMCKTYFKDGFRPDIKHKPEIVDEGYFSKYSSRNKAQILDHLRTPLHQQARLYYLGIKSASTEEKLAEAWESAQSIEKDIFRPTMNALELSYAVMKAGISFRAYPTIVKGVQKLGVALGTHHQHEHALQHFCETFSKSFHNTLLTHLVANNVPFSFLADATTYKNTPYLVCLFQSIEGGFPIIYYWTLIELTNGETSRNMWADIQNKIRLDDSAVLGFENYFKNNIVSFISDMAGTMIGKTNSVWAHLKNYIGREIPAVSCSNHRLERVIHHALNFVTGVVEKKPFRYYFSFRDKNNKFYSFYMSFGSNRWAHLTETATELGVTAHRIKYHFSIRWASSSKRAMESLYKDYDILATDLKSVSVRSKTVTKETSDKASELFQIVSDKTFAITVAEFVDFLSVFEKMSLALQTKSALLVGKVLVLRKGFLEITHLKSNIGPKVTEFLGNSSCDGLCEESFCTLSQYDSCTKIIKGSIELTNTDSSAAKLSEHRETLYRNLESQLKKYFNYEQLEAFELFNPRNFKWTCPSTSSIGKCHILEDCYKEMVTIDPGATAKSVVEKFKKVCEFYSFSVEYRTRLLESWKLVLEQIVTSSEYEKLEHEDPSMFWPHVLLDKKISLPADVRKLIERILVTGLSNSESERAFSIATRYKTGDRSSLSSKNLDALLRIAINGPDELSETSVYKYTKEFLKKYSRVDDPYSGGRRVKNDLKNYFTKSRLF